MRNFLIVIWVLVVSLSGCMNAAVTGAQAVYDRHNLKKSINDHYVSLRANQAIYVKSTRFNDTHVSVSCFNGVVLLTGQVPDPLQREAIEHIVRQIADNYAGDFYNRITVSSPSSALTRLSDSWITAKITAQLIASEEVDPSQVKVVTENGTVYLMGTVERSQGRAAIDIARSTEGVQEVVKMFSWIHISKS